MQASQTWDPLSTDTSAMARLHDFLRQRQAAQEPVADLETFEQQLHALFVAVERVLLKAVYHFRRLDREELVERRYDVVHVVGGVSV
jgi:hypothetical protein